MDTTTSIFLTGIIVTVGRWTKGEGLTVRLVIGVVFLALMLSVINNADTRIAKGLAGLVLLTALFTYGPDIFRKLGLAR